MLVEAKAQTRFVPVGERLDARLKFIERAKKRLESADQDVIKAQEVRASRETQLSEELANLQRLRSEATSAAPVPPVGVGVVADSAEEIRRLRAHISLLESGSMDTSRELMRQKKAKTLNARGDALCIDAVGQSRRCSSSNGSEHVDVNSDKRGTFGFEECQTTRAVNTLRDARYGLRGVRVGEASRPGPPKPSIRVRGV